MSAQVKRDAIVNFCAARRLQRAKKSSAGEEHTESRRYLRGENGRNRLRAEEMRGIAATGETGALLHTGTLSICDSAAGCFELLVNARPDRAACRLMVRMCRM